MICSIFFSTYNMYTYCGIRMPCSSITHAYSRCIVLYSPVSLGITPLWDDSAPHVLCSVPTQEVVCPICIMDMWRVRPSGSHSCQQNKKCPHDHTTLMFLSMRSYGSYGLSFCLHHPVCLFLPLTQSIKF